MCLKYLTILLCCSLVLGKTHTEKLLDSANYMLNVTQQFIYELEDYGLCNTKIVDINQTIAASNYFGYEVKGQVKYTNGFLNTFQEVTLEQTPQEASIDEKTNSAHMSMSLIFSSLMFYYDYHATLTKGNFSGTVAVPINSMRATLYVDKYFSTDKNLEKLEYKVKITGDQGSILVRKWYYEPSNHYTEIINKGVTLNLDKSYKLIEDLWTKLLGRAIEKFPFPKMCFMC